MKESQKEVRRDKTFEKPIIRQKKETDYEKLTRLIEELKKKYSRKTRKHYLLSNEFHRLSTIVNHVFPSKSRKTLPLSEESELKLPALNQRSRQFPLATLSLNTSQFSNKSELFRQKIRIKRCTNLKLCKGLNYHNYRSQVHLADVKNVNTIMKQYNYGSGKHFIPLKKPDSSQILLDSYPISSINLLIPS